MAISAFRGDNLAEWLKSALICEWKIARCEWEQQRWAYVLDEGLISAEEASDMADKVWGLPDELR